MPEETSPRTYLVESYWPDVSEEALAAAVDRVQEALHDPRARTSELEFLGAILVPADETVFCLFRGLEDDVRAVSTRAGITFDRVLQSIRLEGRRTSEDGR